MTRRKAAPALTLIKKVRAQFQELTGEEPLTISGLAQVEGGWQATVEVVELRRIPDSTSLLASYRVTTDAAGDIAQYERVRRYQRGAAD
jgi:Gas vesicle synthesis protein GvpO